MMIHNNSIVGVEIHTDTRSFTLERDDEADYRFTVFDDKGDKIINCILGEPEFNAVRSVFNAMHLAVGGAT